MILPKQFLDEIRARLNISDIIGRRIKTTRAGNEFKACCPFHNEKTPSFTINDQKGFYHCFGCGAHGDVIKFIIEHDNTPFMEVVEALSGEAGLQMPKLEKQDIAKINQQKSLYELMEIAGKWFEDQLYSSRNQHVLNYLTGRGLSLDTIKKFKLGYAPNDTDSLAKYLISEGFKNPDMIDVALLRKSTYGNQETYPFFRDRVIFPVMDKKARIVAFGGRIIPEYAGGIPTPGKTMPKYVNSSDTPLFNKGSMVYGIINDVRKSLNDGNPAIVVEGYMDVIALANAGINSAVAPLGTALTESQISEIWKMSPPDNRMPILCFDGDEAGNRASIRAVDRSLPLLSPDHSIRIARLPKGEDPDSIVTNLGAHAFNKFLSSAKSLFDTLWSAETENRDFNVPEQRAGTKRSLENKIMQIADKDVQSFYLQEIRQKFYNLNKQTYQNKKFNKKTSVGIKVVKPVSNVVLQRQKIMLITLINHPEIFDEISEKLGMLNIQDVRLDLLKQEILNILTMDKLEDRTILIDNLKDNGFEQDLEELLNPDIYLHAGFAKPDMDIDDALKGWLDIWGIALSIPK